MTVDPHPEGESGKLIEAILIMFQQRGDWPTFDQLDKYADRRLGVSDADRVLLNMPRDLVPGLAYMNQIAGDQPIKLTVRAIAGTDGGTELATAFVRSVSLAARLEEERLDDEPSPTLTPDDIGPALPAAGRDHLLKQLGRVLEVERWGWTSAGIDYPWEFTIGRDVRTFRGIENVEDYILRSGGYGPFADSTKTPVGSAFPPEESSAVAKPDSEDHEQPENRPGATNLGRATTAFITWSHTEPGWSASQQRSRKDVVLSIANWLRTNGIDVDTDIYHHQEGIDWSRWGLQRIAEVDHVLIATSPAWARAWEGTGPAHVGGGAAAEADALKTMYERDRSEFVKRVRLIVPPGEPSESVPAGLVGTRYVVETVPDDGLIDLLRDLTRQPRHPMPTLGTVPALPSMPDEPTSSQIVRIGQRNHITNSGEIVVASPVVSGIPGAVAIQQQVDALVNDALQQYDDNENYRREIGAPANHATERWIPTLVSESLISFLVEGDFVVPGRATSYQRTFGVVLEAHAGRRLTEADVFVEGTSWRSTLLERFIVRASEVVDGATTATSLPDPLTFAVTRFQFGVATSRYDIGPGVLGAPTVWIDHADLDWHYRNEFLRLLRES